MKTLLILRHGKSSWKESGLADHERPLKKRGKREAAQIGQMLKNEDLVPDLIISSTAVRARGTAERVVAQCGYEGEIVLDRSLYGAGPGAYLEALQGLTAAYPRVMVVGHNPDLEELVTELTDQAEALATGALVQVELPIENWPELTDDTQGKLVQIWSPRDDEDK